MNANPREKNLNRINMILWIYRIFLKPYELSVFAAPFLPGLNPVNPVSVNFF
jgi:hypothetical protein